MWSVEFYSKSDGTCPAQEFLDSLSPKNDVPFILRDLELLSEKGFELRRPYVDNLGQGIWELRTRTQSGHFRMFYFFFDGHKIIVTHGMHKKQNKVPPNEIARAQEYRIDYLERHEGKRK